MQNEKQSTCQVRDKKKHNYLVDNLQGFLQMLVLLVGKGYIYYCPILLTMKKEDRWWMTDNKILNKYEINKSSHQRYRLSKKGWAKFYYIRYERWAFILHSKGDTAYLPFCDDVFKNILFSPIILWVSEYTGFILQSSQRKGEKLKTSVRLSDITYNWLKDILLKAVRSGDIDVVKKEFDKLNGFNSWKGIIAQKTRLAKFVAKMAKKHKIRLNKKELRFSTYKKIYKIYKDQED